MTSLLTLARRRLAGAAAALLDAAAIASPPSEAGTPKIPVGTLTCNGHGGVGLDPRFKRDASLLSLRPLERFFGPRLGHSCVSGLQAP
jgi:hypothetical protein